MSVETEELRDTVYQLVHGIDPAFFLSKRWFGSKSQTIAGYRTVELDLLEVGSGFLCYLLLEISYVDSAPELFQLPLALAREESVPLTVKMERNNVAFVVPSDHGPFWAYDALEEDAYCIAMYQAMYDDRRITMRHGELASCHIPGRMNRGEPLRIRRITTEQSNSSVVYDERLILKVFRTISPGPNPDFEVPFFLTTRTDFDYVPKVAGYLEYHPTGNESTSAAVLQDFVSNQGDCYTNALRWVREYCDAALAFIEENPDYTPQEQRAEAVRWTYSTQKRVHRLGLISGQLHNALASSHEPPDFRPETVTINDVERWETGIANEIREAIGSLRARSAALPPHERDLLHSITEQEFQYQRLLGGLDVLYEEQCVKIRCHGDYHLGQVLQAGNDFIVLDFEGEPARPLAERRAKHCPLRDVAGLLRSFDYAAYGALFALWQERASDDKEKAQLESWAQTWRDLACDALVAGYHEAIDASTGPRFAPSDSAAFSRVVRIFQIEKAFYELIYEFNNRPDWIPIPARGLLRALTSD